MTIKPTLFVVTDIETTRRKRIAFDVAWQIIDRRGRLYDSGSYLIREAFFQDVPYFSEKLGHYFDDTHARLITPSSISFVRNEYNKQVQTLQQAGHRVILCAYNAAFDFKYLPETYNLIKGTEGKSWMKTKVEIMDIWDFWGNSVPKEYANIAPTSETGRFVSTSAESAFAYEFKQPGFEERHIAWHDVQIEVAILLKALARKKKMAVVNSPRELAGAVWKKINTRLGIAGNALLPQAPGYVPA